MKHLDASLSPYLPSSIQIYSLLPFFSTDMQQLCAEPASCSSQAGSPCLDNQLISKIVLQDFAIFLMMFIFPFVDVIANPLHMAALANISYSIYCNL